jgi:iron(III) transport system ATP-binding protein
MMLKVTGLAKSFTLADGGAVPAVDGVDFTVEGAQCFALLGPSGCGKTTALRCVAGLEQPDRGTVEIGGRVVSDAARGLFVPTHARRIGMVFQSYAIWPHLDVFENVAYPLRVERPRPRTAEIEARVMDVLALVGMQEMARRAAPLLSGGQQQRVALARALVRRPDLLLLDEPLSNLDARLREAMRRELAALIRRIGCTALFVTPDQVEALSLADRVAVMNRGRILQEGTPTEVYDRPKSLFVAGFLGAANRLGGRVAARTPAGELRVTLDCNGRTLTLAGEGGVGEAVDVVLRPEDLTLAAAAPADNAEAIPGTIVSAAFQGAGIDYEVDVGGATLRVLLPASASFTIGAQVWIAVARSSASVFRRDAPP